MNKTPRIKRIGENAIQLVMSFKNICMFDAKKKKMQPSNRHAEKICKSIMLLFRVKNFALGGFSFFPMKLL